MPFSTTHTKERGRDGVIHFRHVYNCATMANERSGSCGGNRSASHLANWWQFVFNRIHPIFSKTKFKKNGFYRKVNFVENGSKNEIWQKATLWNSVFDKMWRVVEFILQIRKWGGVILQDDENIKLHDGYIEMELWRVNKNGNTAR